MALMVLTWAQTAHPHTHASAGGGGYSSFLCVARSGWVRLGLAGMGPHPCRPGWVRLGQAGSGLIRLGQAWSGWPGLAWPGLDFVWPGSHRRSWFGGWLVTLTPFEFGIPCSFGSIMALMVLMWAQTAHPHTHASPGGGGYSSFLWVAWHQWQCRLWSAKLGFQVAWQPSTV